MGVLLSLPILGSLGGIATSALAGLAFCFTSHAGMSTFMYRFFVLCSYHLSKPLCSVNHAIVTHLSPLVLDLPYVGCCMTVNATNPMLCGDR